jgi:UDP-N-acetylglucosamine 3-dehydrogenase
MMETIKTAVIGAGAMGANHCRIYSEKTDFTAVADVDAKLSKTVGEKYGCKSYTDYGKMLKAEKPDAVTVAVPTQYHAKVAIDCIKAGSNILVEKPIADTVANAKRIIDEAEKNGVKLMIGHIERFNPAVQELKKRLDKKNLGKVFSVHATRVGPFPHRIRDVGVVIDLAVHDIDIMRYITQSNVKRVYAETEKRIHTSCEDMLSGLLKFKNGATGILDINWLTPEKIRELKVTGERGMYHVEYISQELTFYENRETNRDYSYQDMLMGVTEGDITKIRIGKKEPLKSEIEAFLTSVKKDTKPPATGEDGLKALEVALAIKDSATKNKVISL